MWLSLWLNGKKSSSYAGDTRGVGSIPGGKIPWRKEWQPTPVFLPGKSYDQRSLVGTIYGVSKVRHN